ncbi:MAG: ATP-binding cassette domain-containing protein [Pseudomonadota bacterium]
MIRLSNVYYRYPHTPEGWVLKGINLTIHEGEYVLLCGASGSGKSTLGYLLNGLIPHFFGGVLEGSVFVSGLETRAAKVSDFISKIGLVLQNSDAQLFNSTVEDEIAFGLESIGLSTRQIERKIDWITDTLHIKDLLNRSPTALSGGEKRLVAIASVLCMAPPVLLLDEPFAHLDWVGARQVHDALLEVHRSGKTVIVIEQRLEGILESATRCLLLSSGKLLFDGHPRDARPLLLREDLMPRYPRKREHKFLKNDPVLVARNLVFKTAGRGIINGISFEVKEGETLAIVGKNGSGKTTLLKQLNGLLRPSEGNLCLMGMDVQKKAPSEMARFVGISFQNPNDQFFKNRVQDELFVGLRGLGVGHDQWLEEICGLFDLHDFLDRSPYRLSEGQKKRVALASILVMRPKLLVLDEPTVGQDGRFLQAITRLLMSLEERGLTILIATHDLEFAEAIARRWIILHEGRVVGDGSPHELMRNEELIRMGAISNQKDRVTGRRIEILKG